MQHRLVSRAGLASAYKLRSKYTKRGSWSSG
jgi:hypothetical protein